MAAVVEGAAGGDGDAVSFSGLPLWKPRVWLCCGPMAAGTSSVVDSRSLILSSIRESTYCSMA